MTEDETKELLKFVKDAPNVLTRIVLSYLPIDDQVEIYDVFNELETERALSPEEKSARDVVAQPTLEFARDLLAQFQRDYGLETNIEAPLPPLIEADALGLGAELKAALEAKQDNDDPPDLGDGARYNGEGPNGNDDHSADFNGPDDEHKESEVKEAEHGR